MSNFAIVVDGNALIYRAYYATQRDQTDDEVAKNFYKTLSSIRKTLLALVSRKQYKYSAVAFDSSRENFRKEKCKEYKSNRASMPKYLFLNLQKIRKVFSDLGFSVVDAPSPYEGDDVVATLSNIFYENKVSVDVYSTDRDLLQLVSDKVSVTLLRPGNKSEIHTLENFQSLNGGLEPCQIPYQKALCGDSSDNYKGVEGIGDITARNLLLKYRDIEGIYSYIDELRPLQKKALLSSKDKVDLFLELACVVKTVDIPQDLSNYENNSRIGESGESV